MTVAVGTYGNHSGTWLVTAGKDQGYLTVTTPDGSVELRLNSSELLHLAGKLRDAEGEASADRWSQACPDCAVGVIVADGYEADTGWHNAKCDAGCGWTV